MYIRSIRDIAKDMVIVPTAQFAWANGYHVAKRVAMPVILTVILVTEKSDQEIDQKDNQKTIVTEYLT